MDNTMIALSGRRFAVSTLFVLLIVVSSLSVETSATKFRKKAAHRIFALPEIEILESIREPATHFTGKFHSEYNATVHKDQNEKPFDPVVEEALMSWEVAWPRTGKRVQKIVSVTPPRAGRQLRYYEQKNMLHAAPSSTSSGKRRKRRRSEIPKRRSKRNIYSSDERLYVAAATRLRFPFASVVRISTGCTGTLVSPRHVLTAAHCIHDQNDYLADYENLKVGFFLTRRSAVAWFKVVKTHLPGGWKIGIPDIAANFDYCLLKLESEHRKPFFRLGISENTTHGVGKRIHFSGFEDDKPTNTMWYRYCEITDADAHILYNYCDAQPGSSGSGVYLWSYDNDERRWARKLIGVFSGTRTKEYGVDVQSTRGNQQQTININYNAAIRINSAKYTQICKWMGPYAANTCKQKYYVD